MASTLSTRVWVCSVSPPFFDPVPSGEDSLDVEGEEPYPLLVKSRISSKGQVTVPIEVRDQLGLIPGTDVEFLVRDGEAVLRKGGGESDPVDRVYGRLKLDVPVDALVDAMRGPRPKGKPKTIRRRRERPPS